MEGKGKAFMNDRNNRPDSPDPAAPGGRIDFDEVRKVIALLEEKNLSAFELETEGFKIKVSRNVPAPAAPAAVVVAPPQAVLPAAGEPAGAPAVEVDKNLHVITSPMVGTFYRAPDPTAPPFADVGDPVKKGQTLCIVEAMKLMNEIESDVDGTVVEVFPENGKPVEFGQKLFAIRPAS
jgi:acetyl-CoA carboxylase biotin carboxyl carrier protein